MNTQHWNDEDNISIKKADAWTHQVPRDEFREFDDGFIDRIIPRINRTVCTLCKIYNNVMQTYKHVTYTQKNGVWKMRHPLMDIKIDQREMYKTDYVTLRSLINYLIMIGRECSVIWPDANDPLGVLEKIAIVETGVAILDHIRSDVVHTQLSSITITKPTFIYIINPNLPRCCDDAVDMDIGCAKCNVLCCKNCAKVICRNTLGSTHLRYTGEVIDDYLTPKYLDRAWERIQRQRQAREQHKLAHPR